MIENTKTYNGHTYSGNLLVACQNGYQQGRADAIKQIVDDMKNNLLLQSGKVDFTLDRCEKRGNRYYFDVSASFNYLVNEYIARLENDAYGE